MQAVGIRELKARLSEYIRRVRAGEVILVTDRGRVVAELREPGSMRGPEGVPAGLAELSRRGLARIGTGNDDARYPELPRLTPDGTASRLLDEERGER